MTPRERTRESLALRERILREAIRLASTRAFDAVSLQEVAEAAETSKQALLYHFESREKLQDAIVDRILSYSNSGLVELLGTLRAQGAAGRMDQVLQWLESFFGAEPEAAVVMLRFLVDGDARVRRRIVEGTKPWLGFAAGLIREGQSAGRIRNELDPEAAVAQIGILVLANFALLPVSGWTDDSPAAWRGRRLAEMVRAIRAILFARA